MRDADLHVRRGMATGAWNRRPWCSGSTTRWAPITASRGRTSSCSRCWMLPTAPFRRRSWPRGWRLTRSRLVLQLLPLEKTGLVARDAGCRRQAQHHAAPGRPARAARGARDGGGGVRGTMRRRVRQPQRRARPATPVKSGVFPQACLPMTTEKIDGAAVATKANVYFDGKCVSHGITLADGTKKSVGVILPSHPHLQHRRARDHGMRRRRLRVQARRQRRVDEVGRRREVLRARRTPASRSAWREPYHYICHFG